MASPVLIVTSLPGNNLLPTDLKKSLWPHHVLPCSQMQEGEKSDLGLSDIYESLLSKYSTILDLFEYERSPKETEKNVKQVRRK